MKRLQCLLATVGLLVALASCQREQPYVIRGSFDMPDSIPAAQAEVLMAQLDGLPVYLVDLRGEFLDSTKVENGEFRFEGKVKEPYFAYLASAVSIDMIALEPGEISVLISDQVEISGTATNDGIRRLGDAIRDLEVEASARVEAITAAGEGADNDSVSQQMAMQTFFDAMGQMYALIDSTIEAHPGDLIGVYAVNLKTSDVSTPEELEEELADQSDFVRMNELFDVRLEYLRNMTDEASGFSPDELGLELDDSDDDGEE